MFRWRKRGKRETEENTTLTEGMILMMDASPQKENRVFTLLLKGILVYLIVMGGMGCFLSALDVKYAWWVVHLVLLLAAVFCSMLYYSTRWENVGYLLLLVVMFLTGGVLRTYINSGFYSVANDMAEQASAFFDSNAMRSYGEQISNRYLAITISMCYIGCVCCILMNILISRRMQYIVAVPLCIGALMLPLYLELEPSVIYIVMLLSGLLAAYVIRGNGHYRLSQKNHSYMYYTKKKQIIYVYAGKTLASIMTVIFLFCLVFVLFFSFLFPREKFQERRTISTIKASTMDTVENLSLLGLMGLFNFYPNTGGLTNGTLGGVSAVRFDYEPDLVFEFAPYAEERMYFKTFTGAHYLPYTNRWSQREWEGADAGEGSSIRTVGQLVDSTILQMKEAYESGNKMSARGRIRVTNTAAAIGMYLPYYSEDTDKVVYPGETVEYTYYPRVSRQSIMIEGKTQQKKQRGQKRNRDTFTDVPMEVWLDIPEENRDVIAQFCQKAGLQESAESPTSAMVAVQQLAAYYQDHIPYTYRPGLTPRGKDFINYFLAENKRGYCAHFASAAVLIFRYLGIPARYVEGYAIDPEDISEEGEILKDKEYRQYYDGYSPLGETGVVSVNVTDANAHAWVEIYEEQQGWQVVEVTPATGEEESSNYSLWRRLMNFFNGGQGVDAAQEAQEARQNAMVDEETRKVSVRAALVLMLLFVLATVGRWGVKKGMQCYWYYRSGRNERLIMRYRGYLRHLSRRQGELADQVNYCQQIRWLAEHHFCEMDGAEQEICVSILEQAGFSEQEITEQEFCQVVNWLKNHTKVTKNVFQE